MIVKRFGCTTIYNKALYKCIIHSQPSSDHSTDHSTDSVLGSGWTISKLQYSSGEAILLLIWMCALGHCLLKDEVPLHLFQKPECFVPVLTGIWNC